MKKRKEKKKKRMMKMRIKRRRKRKKKKVVKRKKICTPIWKKHTEYSMGHTRSLQVLKLIFNSNLHNPWHHLLLLQYMLHLWQLHNYLKNIQIISNYPDQGQHQKCQDHLQEDPLKEGKMELKKRNGERKRKENGNGNITMKMKMVKRMEQNQ